MQSTLIGMDSSQLLKMLESVELFSETESHIHDALMRTVTQEVKSDLENGVIPVFRLGESLVLAIHPSAKQCGAFQVTQYSVDRGVLGDSQYPSIERAVSREGLWFRKRLAHQEARCAVSLAISAEQVACRISVERQVGLAV